MIEVKSISKSFKRYQKPSHRLKEIVLGKPCHQNYQALRNISFRAEQGQTLGILGRNGAGKSTLLKILNGVLLPDSGSVVSSGKTTALLELGTGFEPSLTGLQNIRTNGLLIGMTEADIARQQQSIIDFAELGSFINEPLRTYSSGMRMRLAFSIAIHADPETFLIDEALSVGDGHFQQKCARRIREFRQQGGSILFVSHDLNAVKMLCDRALVLNNGEIVASGEPEEAVNYYNQLLAGEGIADVPIELQGYGSLDAAILSATLAGNDSRGSIVTSGEKVTLDVDIEGRAKLPEITLGMVIRDRFGQDMFGTNSHVLGQTFSLAEGERCKLRFHFDMKLAPGKYTVTLALHEGVDHTRQCYHWWDNAAQFQVTGIRGPIFVGLCNLSPTMEKLPLQ
jgi:homopolymeric O-antigen transport system ATP-binding protein